MMFWANALKSERVYNLFIIYSQFRNKKPHYRYGFRTTYAIFRKEVTSMQFVAGFILGGLFGLFILCMFMQGSDDSYPNFAIRRNAETHG